MNCLHLNSDSKDEDNKIYCILQDMNYELVTSGVTYAPALRGGPKAW